MSRLVVISNRVADPRKPAAGGLAVALGEALNKTGGLWFGWSGTVTEDGAPGETELHMRQAEATASIHGHILTDWEMVSGSDLEYQASCKVCGGFVYVSHASTYNLLLDSCERIHVEEVE